MSKWVIKGLRTGIKTTQYPRKVETAPGVSPGLPTVAKGTEEEVQELVFNCPTGAIERSGNRLTVDYNYCIHCFRCKHSSQSPMGWDYGYEWAANTKDGGANRGLGSAFNRSINIRFVDGGACGACISEIEQLNKPYYNMHRLGFFATPTPREADVLLVAGPVTDHMRLPLKKAYDAMPTPKLVMAVGACALSGGIFGPSFMSGSGVSELIPVGVAVPGCPPPPLAIIHGLLLAVKRKSSALLTSSEVRG